MLSKIMKTAWNLFRRNNNRTFSECLRMAWAAVRDGKRYGFEVVTSAGKQYGFYTNFDFSHAAKVQKVNELSVAHRAGKLQIFGSVEFSVLERDIA